MTLRGIHWPTVKSRALRSELRISRSTYKHEPAQGSGPEEPWALGRRPRLCLCHKILVQGVANMSQYPFSSPYWVCGKRLYLKRSRRCFGFLIRPLGAYSPCGPSCPFMCPELVPFRLSGGLRCCNPAPSQMYTALACQAPRQARGTQPESPCPSSASRCLSDPRKIQSLHQCQAWLVV